MLKPNTGSTPPPSAPYQRNDDFSGPKLANVWQWNHVPDDTKWSLSEGPGLLRLHALPARDFWWARNTLTQRGIGPESIPPAELDAGGMKPGDVAGLALVNLPSAWIGVRFRTNGLVLAQFNLLIDKTSCVPLGTQVPDALPAWSTRPLFTADPQLIGTIAISSTGPPLPLAWLGLEADAWSGRASDSVDA